MTTSLCGTLEPRNSRRRTSGPSGGRRCPLFRASSWVAAVHFAAVLRFGEALNPGPGDMYDVSQMDGMDDADEEADFLDDWRGLHFSPGTPFPCPPGDVWHDLEADGEIEAAFTSQRGAGGDLAAVSYVHDQPHIQEVGDRWGYSESDMLDMVKVELEWERVLAEGSAYVGPYPEIFQIVAPLRNADGGIVVPSDQLDQWELERQALSTSLAEKYKDASRAYAARMAAQRALRSSRREERRCSSSATERAVAVADVAPPASPMLEEEEILGGQPALGVAEVDQEAAARAAKLRGPTNRPRGRRKRASAGSTEVWTLNSSGRPQLLAAVAAAQAMGKGKVCAILSQEHHARGSAIADLQADLRRCSWRMAVVSATRGEGGGASAGVGVATPSHVPSGLRPGWSSDSSPKAHPGRICIHWVQAVVPCGILCVSVYFYHTEGASPRNLSLLDQALARARASECLWCLALDANQTPTDLLTWAAPLIHMSKGKVIAPDVPTHYPAVGEARTIDFFIVHSTLAAAVEKVDVVDLVASKPHRAVSISFKANGIPRMQTAIKAPRRFPRGRPIGCSRHPVAPPAGYTRNIAEAATTDEMHDAVDECWSNFIASAEAELCGITDAWRGEAPDHRWCGRSDGVEFVQVPVLPVRASREMGKVDHRGQVYLWAENRLRELAVLAQHARKHGPLEGARRRQWTSIVKKMTAPTSAISQVRQEDARWETLVDRLKLYEGEPASAVEFLTSSANWSHALLLNRKRTREKELARSWAVF
jgi:hypothetical protein